MSTGVGLTFVCAILTLLTIKPSRRQTRNVTLGVLYSLYMFLGYVAITLVRTMGGA